MSKGIVHRFMGGTSRHSWALTMIILAVCLGLVSSSAFASGSNFVRTTQKSVPTMEKAVAFGYIDDDLLLDIVVAYQSHEWPATWSATDTAEFTIRWFKNNGNSEADNWTEPYSASPYVFKADAFPTNSDPDPANTHAQYKSFNKIDWVSDIKVADLDNDGKNDIVFSTCVEGVKWIRNGGPSGAWVAGNFGTQATNAIRNVTQRPIHEITTGNPPGGVTPPYYPNVRRILATNLDNDTDVDLVFAQAETGGGANANSVIRVFYGNGSGAFTETDTKPLIAADLLPFCVSLRAYELVETGDDRPEIVATGIGGATAATDKVRVIQTAGTDNTIVESGNLNLTANYGADPFDTGIGKIDNDSFVDLVVVSSQTPAVTWYKGSGTLTGFSYAGSIDNGTRVGKVNTMSPRSDYYPVFCHVTDWDMDGDADIVASYFWLTTPNAPKGAVVYYENTGIYSASFSSEYLPISNTGPHGEDIHPMMVDMASAQQEINASPSIDNFQDIVVAQLGTVSWPPAPPPLPTEEAGWVAGSGTVSFWNNLGYRSFGPVVTGAVVLTEPDYTHRRVQITFSKKMDASGATGDPWNVLNPANYVASGPATAGWGTFTPDSVTKISDTVWQLNFTGAQLLADGADLTIECNGNLREVDGVLPDYVPLQNPKNATVTCRMDLTVTDVFTYTDWDPLMTAVVAIGGGCGSVVKDFKWDSADSLGNVLATLKAWSSTSGADQLQLTHPVDDYQYFFSYVRDAARLTEEVRTDLVTLRAMPPLTASIPISLPGPPKDYGYTGRSGDDFTLVVTPAGGYGPALPDEWGPYSYQWQRWNGSSWEDLPQLPMDYVRTLPGEPTSQDVTTTISGGTSATLNVVNGIATFDDRLYRCRVRDAKFAQLGRTAYSNEVWVRLSDNPNFSDHPDSANQYIGNTHHLEVSIIGGLPPYTKTWQKWTETFPGSGVWAWTTVPGSANDRMHDLAGLTTDMVGDYRCRVEDSDEVVGISDVATVNVREKVHFTTHPAASTTIRTAQDLMPGGAADPFVVVVEGGYPDVYLGGAYQYEWRRDIGGGLGVVPDGAQPRTIYPGACSVDMTTSFAGRYSAHLTVDNALKYNGDTGAPVVFDEGTYSCYAFDGNTTVPIGDGPSKTSDNAILTIQDLVAVVVEPVDSPKMYVGESTQFSVTLIGGSGPAWDYDTMGYGYQYVWVSKGINPLPGSGTETVPGCFNGNTFTAGPLTTSVNGDINCEVWDYMPPAMGGGTGRASSLPALLNVAEGVTVTTPSGPTHCNTLNAVPYEWTVTASKGWPAYTYTWQFYNGSTWVDLADGAHPSGSGSTVDVDDASLRITGMGLLDAGQYQCTVADSINDPGRTGSITTSSPVTVTVTDLFDVNDITVDSSTWSPGNPNHLYVGDAFTLGVSVTGGAAPYTYTWKLGADTVKTETIADLSSQYAVPVAALTDAGLYTCAVEDSSPDPDLTSPVGQQMTVFANLAITGNPPATEEGNIADPMEFHVTASGGWVIAPQTLHYQWQRKPMGADDSQYADVPDGGHTTGAQTPDLTIAQLAQADQGDYRCVVTDNGPVPQVQNSSMCTLTVTDYLRIPDVYQPVDQNVYLNDTITFSVVVGGGVPPYSYEWIQVGIGVVGTGDTLTISPAQLTHAGEYYVTITDSSVGVNPPLDSWHAFATVYLPVSVTDPVDVTIYTGDDAEFSVAASNGYPPVTYQWWADLGTGDEPLTEGAFNITGVQTNTLHFTSTSITLDGEAFWCVATAHESDDPASPATNWEATSAAAVLHVVTPVAFYLPEDQAAYVGTNPDPDFTIAATVEYGLNKDTYEWQRSLAGLGSFAPVAGGSGDFGFGNSAILNVSPAVEAVNDYDYRLQVVDDVKTSDSGNVKFRFAPHLRIIEQPEDVTVPKGQAARFEVVVEGGLGDISAQWHFQPAGTKAFTPIPGEDGLVLVIDPVEDEDEGDYMCTVNDLGQSSVTGISDQVESDSVSLTIGAGVPAAGPLGLMAFALATSLAGVIALRRRRN